MIALLLSTNGNTQLRQLNVGLSAGGVHSIYLVWAGIGGSHTTDTAVFLVGGCFGKSDYWI
jgi:hypothetical protein